MEGALQWINAAQPREGCLRATRCMLQGPVKPRVMRDCSSVFLCQGWTSSFVLLTKCCQEFVSISELELRDALTGCVSHGESVVKEYVVSGKMLGNIGA